MSDDQFYQRMRWVIIGAVVLVIAFEILVIATYQPKAPKLIEVDGVTCVAYGKELECDF